MEDWGGLFFFGSFDFVELAGAKSCKNMGDILCSVLLEEQKK